VPVGELAIHNAMAEVDSCSAATIPAALTTGTIVVLVVFIFTFSV